MAKLRDPATGCPWDVKQDFASIAPYTIEEAYEVAEAIEQQDWQDLKAELGDLLLQTVYHTQMASEAKLFDFETLATYSYQFAHDELMDQASLPALVIVVVGLIPVVFLNRLLRAYD